MKQRGALRAGVPPSDFSRSASPARPSDERTGVRNGSTQEAREETHVLRDRRRAREDGQPEGKEEEEDVAGEVEPPGGHPPLRAAILSTYPPRACGIGSFAFDLRAALLDDPEVASVEMIAVIDQPSSPQTGDILATVTQSVRGDYIRAARLLSRLDVDVVLLQHEYGIFGGPAGDYVLSFAQALSQPLVVTLHTVVSAPSKREQAVLTALCEQAQVVTVMTETAKQLLLAGGACPEAKIRVVPHGAPVILGRLVGGTPRERLAGRSAYRLSA